MSLFHDSIKASWSNWLRLVLRSPLLWRNIATVNLWATINGRRRRLLILLFWWRPNHERQLSAFWVPFDQLRRLSGWQFVQTRLFLLKLLIGELTLFDFAALPVTPFTRLDGIHDGLEGDLATACISDEFVDYFLGCLLLAKNFNHGLLERLLFLLHLQADL